MGMQHAQGHTSRWPSWNLNLALIPPVLLTPLWSGCGPPWASRRRFGVAGELELLGRTSGPGFWQIHGSQHPPPGTQGSRSRPQPVFQAAQRNCCSMPGSLAGRSASCRSPTPQHCSLGPSRLGPTHLGFPAALPELPSLSGQTFPRHLGQGLSALLGPCPGQGLLGRALAARQHPLEVLAPDPGLRRDTLSSSLLLEPWEARATRVTFILGPAAVRAQGLKSPSHTGSDLGKSCRSCPHGGGGMTP